MNEETLRFRGRIVPKEDSGEEKAIKEDVTVKADEILARRQRGRVLPGGEVLSPEERRRRLEAREGYLSLGEADELRGLRFEQDGSILDRTKPKPNENDKRKTKWP